jgi:hypothetical protein
MTFMVPFIGFRATQRALLRDVFHQRRSVSSSGSQRGRLPIEAARHVAFARRFELGADGRLRELALGLLEARVVERWLTHDDSENFENFQLVRGRFRDFACRRVFGLR